MALLGALAFHLALAVTWPWVRGLQLPYTRAFVELTVWVTCALLFYVVSEPIRIRRGQWRRMGWYPPSWFAVPFALVVAALAEILPLPYRPRLNGPEWRHFSTIGPPLAALVVAIAARHWQAFLAAMRTSGPSSADGEDSRPGKEVLRWIDAGERPITGKERDLFGHNPIADRIVQVAGRDGRSVALLGRFGSGKSSILNFVQAKIERDEPAVIMARFDVWAVPRPEDVPRLALNRIVAALDEHVDTIQFRSLPFSYQRLAAAEPTGRLASAIGAESASDPLDELERLAPLLEVLDARLLLIVEDVERTGPTFDTRHLQRFLWAFQGIRRTSFILATEPEYPSLDVSKLCDTIELIPPIQPEIVAEILRVAHVSWRAAFSYIDPHPARSQGDKLLLELEGSGGLMVYLRRAGRDSPLDALVELLDSPRSLKHVLRRVNLSWSELHGEAELEDILIVSALRHGAEPAYRFLLQEIDAARHEPDSLLPRTVNVKSDWEELIRSLPVGVAVQKLVDLMGIEQLSSDRTLGATRSPQGVHLFEPVDYFRRIVAERLEPSEIHDQSVLRDIDEWRRSRSDRLVSSLVTREDNKMYVRVWEHFSFRHENVDELVYLTEEISRRILEREASSASATHSALLALLRCRERLRGRQNLKWIQRVILSAVPVSLRFTNEFYRYWVQEDDSIVSRHEGDVIRHSIVESVRAQVRSGDDLVRILTSEMPYQVGALVTDGGERRGDREFEEWREYLAPILVQGATRSPELVLPEVANMVGDERSGVTAGPAHAPVFVNRYKIVRARMTAVFGNRLREMLSLLANYDGDNPYVVRAKPEAQSWLDEEGE